MTTLTEFEVTAVATTRHASADKAAAAHGVPLAFADADALVTHQDVDLVVVSVKAPSHADVVQAALAAGKHVLCEWPLGVDAAESQTLAAAAEAAGVTHAVNLQGYQSPDARFVAELLADGAIGRLESVALVAADDPLGGSRIAPELAWSTDPAGGPIPGPSPRHPGERRTGIGRCPRRRYDPGRLPTGRSRRHASPIPTSTPPQPTTAYPRPSSARPIPRARRRWPENQAQGLETSPASRIRAKWTKLDL